MSTDAVLKVRRRFLEDFEFYSERALKIRDKGGNIVHLVPNAAQRILLDTIKAQQAKTGRVRVIILKGRQQGLSTVVGGFMYYQISQRKGAKGMVVAHKADSTQTLFDLVKRYHDNCPGALKPSTKYSSRRELTFDRLDSAYTVATAGGESIARGETLTHLHCSEVGFWPSSSARDIWNGLRQAVPDAKGSFLALESTANGVGNLFHDLWLGAERGENEFTAVFIPWFLSPEYSVDPSEMPEAFERTPEEAKIAALAHEKYGHVLLDEQLMWRRRRVAEGGLEKFQQEYPNTPQEAFLTSGRPVFNPSQLHRILNEDVRPPARRALEGVELGAPEWPEHPRGELAVYHEPDPAETYVIGADVGAGVQKDWSVAQVLDSKKRQVAVWRGQIHPDAFATTLYHLGKHYHEAKVAVESNNHGLLTVHQLAKVLLYPNVYQSVVVEKTEDVETINLGFRTTAKSKPLIIDQLRGDMREEAIKLYDQCTVEEMQTFVVTEAGKMEAEKGCHDDNVMALAIANHVHDGVYEPIVNDDSFYHEGV